MATVEERAHANLADFNRFCARLDPGASLLDEAGVVACAGTVDFPATRSAVRTDPAGPAAEVAAAIDEFLAKFGRTAAVHARIDVDDDLTAALAPLRFREWETTPEMVCDAPLPERPSPDGVRVRFAESAADVHAYAAIAGQAFAHLQVPAAVTSGIIDHPDVVLAPDYILALAELDEAIVAGALVILCPAQRGAYVSWVSCADSARGRGLGDVVTRAVTNEAFERGADLVTLEASSFGRNTYARMGYRELYRYRLLIRI